MIDQNRTVVPVGSAPQELRARMGLTAVARPPGHFQEELLLRQGRGELQRPLQAERGWNRREEIVDAPRADLP